MSLEEKEKSPFSISSRLKSTNHAWRGVVLFFRTTHNAWIQLAFGALAIYLGFILHISHSEWVLVILSIGLVLMAEAFNTAIETDMDLTSPDYHPFARDTKDIAAGAVLLMSFFAGVSGVIIFLPKILPML